MSGDIIEVARTGSMYLMETYTYDGWSGSKYDKIQLICTTAGAYGIAKVKLLYFGNDKLAGSETSDIIVTGGLQHIAHGLYVRWEGNSMTLNDRWDIVLRNLTMQDSNASVKSIDLTRNPYERKDVRNKL